VEPGGLAQGLVEEVDDGLARPEPVAETPHQLTLHAGSLTAGRLAESGERLLRRYPVDQLEAFLEMVRDGAAVTEAHIRRIRGATRARGDTPGPDPR
jgi:hypothetical protein